MSRISENQKLAVDAVWLRWRPHPLHHQSGYAAVARSPRRTSFHSTPINRSAHWRGVVRPPRSFLAHRPLVVTRSTTLFR
ncbi:MAG: hypothetical protein NTZ08_02455 [Verrucomicrobia bacterium]|nr:hypothetical protein [Verrucomicrobiota bacterium]